MANPLEFVITAKDLASEQFKKLGETLDKSKSSFDGVRKASALLGGAAIAAMGAFAKASVDAAQEAETKQQALEDAYKKFPALAHGNINALRELNEAIMGKTGADVDDLAQMESTLAMYGANQSQIEKLAPLVVDFAAKTHVSMDQAAKSVGMGLAGQTRALRQVGIDYHATGNKAKDLAAVTDGLAKTVGGYAEGQGKTAAGQTKILGAEFTELKVTVGDALLPILKQLTGMLINVVKWFISLSPNVKLVIAGVAALGAGIMVLIGATKVWTAITKAWTVAQAIANAVMDANPIAMVILAIAALIAIIVLLVTHWKQVVAFIRAVWGAVVKWLQSVTSGFGHWWSSFWSGVGSTVANIWNNGIVNPIKRAINFISTGIRVGLGVIRGVWSNIWNGLIGIVRGVMNSVIGAVQGGINGAIDIVNGLIGAFNSVAGLVHIHISAIPHVHFRGYANGTDDAPGGFAVVGENGPEVMRVPEHAQITPHGKPTTVELGPDSVRAVGRMVYSMIQEGAYVAIGDALGG